jgi:hypothetical protein
VAAFESKSESELEELEEDELNELEELDDDMLSL